MGWPSYQPTLDGARPNDAPAGAQVVRARDKLVKPQSFAYSMRIGAEYIPSTSAIRFS